MFWNTTGLLPERCGQPLPPSILPLEYRQWCHLLARSIPGPCLVTIVYSVFGYLYTRILRYLDTWIPGYLDTWMSRYLDSWMPGCNKLCTWRSLSQEEKQERKGECGHAENQCSVISITLHLSFWHIFFPLGTVNHGWWIACSWLTWMEVVSMPQ